LVYSLLLLPLAIRPQDMCHLLRGRYMSWLWFF